MTRKGQCFALTQDIEAATTAQLQVLTKEDSRATSESGENDGVCSECWEDLGVNERSCVFHCNKFFQLFKTFTISLDHTLWL